MKFNFRIERVFLISVSLFLISLIYFGLTSPITLEKILSLKAFNKSILTYKEGFTTTTEAEISDFIANIPYKGDEASASWFIDPKLKYEDTIINGNGNCSNLAFGAMFEFNNLRRQAAIVHMFKNDLGFLVGIGHTVLQISVEGRNTVVDILEGGIPLQNGKGIDALKFNYNSTDIYSNQNLNNLKDNKNDYFTNDYLAQISFGLVPQNEISDYFLFLDRVYLPLGSVFLEKLVFDNLALLFGQYPNTYVSKDFLLSTFQNAKLKTLFAYLNLISFHLSYLTFLLLNVKLIIRVLTRNTNNK